MKVGLKCVIIPELKYAHLCSESTSLSLRMTFSDSNMTLKISNKSKHDSFTFDFSSQKACFVVVTHLFTASYQEMLINVKWKSV